MSKCNLCNKPATKEVRLVTVDREGNNPSMSMQFTCTEDARTVLKKVCENRDRRVQRFVALNLYD